MNSVMANMLLKKLSILRRPLWALSTVCLISFTLLSDADAGEVKILSYNVMANWDQQRGGRIVAVIEDQNPDIVGLQEGIGDNVDYLVGKLARDYDAHFIGTEVPVFILKTESLRLIDSGSTEIFKCLLDRYVNWIRLEDTTSGREFIYYNTHLCFMLRDTLEGITNEEANQTQAGQIMDVMAAHAEDGVVQIIGGDLNTFSSSNTTRFFLEQRPLPVNGQENPLSLKESWAAAPGNSGERPRTTGGGAVGGAPGGGQGQRGMGTGRGASGPGGEGQRAMGRGGGMAGRIEMPDEPGIDWLFVSEYADVVAAEVIKDDLTNGTSDHLPISATIVF